MLKHSLAVALFVALAISGATSYGSSLPSTRAAKAPGSGTRTQAKANSESMSADWTRWARAVGQAEENRDLVIAKLKSIPNLKSHLLTALPTSNRALALDVMSALEMHDLVSELLVYMSADEEGFITLTINSLLDEKQQGSVLKSYVDNLSPDNLTRFSAATIVAMLEPIGRLGLKLPAATLQNLNKQPSPEVRGATLYYLRMMALTHHDHSQDSLAKVFLKSGEFQLRLQAVSTLTEFLQSRDPDFSNLTSRDELTSLCKREKSATVGHYCLSLTEKPKGER